MIGTLVGRLCADRARFTLTLPNDFASATKVSLPKIELRSTSKSSVPV